LTDLAEGVLFVVRAGVTPVSLVNKAIAQLDDSREKLRAIVMNDVRSDLPGWLRRLCGFEAAGAP
jgi:Mrp family chromosome partitioning ATPase